MARQYGALPLVFRGFPPFPELTDGKLRLLCVQQVPADPVRHYVPAYKLAICLGAERIGGLDLRLGYSEALFYSGQVGYAVGERWRGKGYAAAACRLLSPLAELFGMETLLICNDQQNAASRRVCEKLGAELLFAGPLPEWHALYQAGHRSINVFAYHLKR